MLIFCSYVLFSVTIKADDDSGAAADIQVEVHRQSEMDEAVEEERRQLEVVELRRAVARLTSIVDEQRRQLEEQKEKRMCWCAGVYTVDCL